MALAYHEAPDKLPAEVIEQHRAIASLIEELEATIWYHERAALSADAQLKSVMEHNRDEEIEHASMLIEWLRRNFPGFEQQLKAYLFTTAALTELEEAGESVPRKPAQGPSTLGGLNIGSLKQGE